MTGEAAEPPSRWRSALRDPGTWAWISAAVAVLVYANALGNGFAYDDVEVIVNHDAIHSWQGLLGALGEPYWPGHYGPVVGVWRPVVTALFGVEWILFGGDPLLFHLVGVLLHGAVTFVCVLVLASLLPLAAVAAAGLLFAVHPVHVEAVANVVGHAEVLAALFVLAALHLHLRGGDRYGPGRTAAIGALFLAGALTKENAVVLPALVFLVDAARRDPRIHELPSYLRRRWPTYAVLAVLGSGFLVARTAVLGTVAPAQSPAGASLIEEVPRVFTLASTWPHYVRLLLWPADLAADYGGVIPVVVRWTPLGMLGVFVALFFLAVAWWGWREGPGMDGDRLTPRALGFAVLWFGVTVLPVSNIVFVSPVVLAERNLYLPSVAAAVGLGYLLATLLRERRSAGLGVAALLVLLGSLRTWDRTPVWRDSWAPFDALMEDHPEAGRAWFFRGQKLMTQGRFAEARRAFAVAVGLLDRHYGMTTTVAAQLSGMDPSHRRAAERLLLQAWAEDPRYYTAPGYLAVLYLEDGRHEEGERFAREAVRRAPENADMHRVLGAHLSAQGRHEEAIRHRLEAFALEDDPPWRWWFWLSRDQLAAGDTASALATLDSARVHAPASEGAGLDSVRARLTEPAAADAGER